MSNDDNADTPSASASGWPLKSGAQRVAAHARRQREQGLIKISVWIPRERAAEFRALALKARLNDDRPLPFDDYDE